MWLKVLYESTKKFSIWKNINKIWNIEIDVCAVLKVKYGSTIMEFIIFAHQVGWFDGKGVDILWLNNNVNTTNI
jgi:hypothetical protein